MFWLLKMMPLFGLLAATTMGNWARGRMLVE